MKTRKLILAAPPCCLILLCCQLLLAEPMGTAFTYQGRLLEDGQPAVGIYDLQCKLFDSKTGGAQIGDTLIFEDGSSPDGYFTVTIDFGVNVFNGEKRHLEMAFRSSESTDPNDFVILSDRVELTPTPYALYAKTAGSAAPDNDWMISGNDMYSFPSGNVGIGITSPQRKLHIEGPALISAGPQGDAGLMVRGTSGTRGPAIGLDNGNQEWNILCWEDNSLSFVKTSGATFTPFSIKNNSFQDALVIASAGVGVRTSNPSTKLDVVGGFQLEDGSEADGNLLVSDKEGNATWKKGRKYTLSGVLNTTSITATTAWTKIDDFITFSKDNSGTDIELVMNTNARAGTFAGGALGVMFEIRIDDNSTYFDNQGSILVSDGDEFISIIAVFQDLDVGNHTVSVWARTAPSGTSTGVVLDPGGLDGRILVKEVW